MLFTPAYAQTAGGSAGAMSGLAGIIPFILMFVIFYFLLIRPQQKKVKAHKAMVEAVRRGDRVVTAGGLIGKVSKVLNDTELQVELAENVRVRVVRSTIQEVLSKSEPAESSGGKGKKAEPERAPEPDEDEEDSERSRDERESRAGGQ